MKTLLPIISVCLLNLFVHPCFSQDQIGEINELVGQLFTMDATTDQAPGAAVLVRKNGETLHQKGYGLANLEHQIPITPETVFDIASVSKQFCGMAIAMLIDQGKISLKDDVRKYIPELPDFGHQITIDHLVHHTSGIRDWPGTLALAGWQFDDVISFDQILRMAYHQQDLNFVPGAEYLYSNTGYNLLAEIVQRVSGQSFRQWTEEHIFEPLDMQHTHFHDDHTEVVPNKAIGYARNNMGEYRLVSNNLTALGSSSLYTSIADLSKWVDNFNDHKVGGQAVYDQMLERGILNNGEQIAYAFGISVDEYRGRKRINHSGSWAGFLTYLVHFPEEKLSVVVLQNHNSISAAQKAMEVADLYLNAGPEETAANGGMEQQETTGEVKVAEHLLQKYEGTYRLGPAWYVTIAKEGDQLTTQATNERAFPMTARSDTEFWVAGYGRSITFVIAEDGRVNSFLYRGMDCPKMEKATFAGDLELKDFTGRYTSKELDAAYEVVLEDGALVARHRRLGDIALSPAYGNEFSGDRFFMSAVEFYRDEQGNVAGFLATSGRSRNQRFVKLPDQK